MDRLIVGLFCFSRDEHDNITCFSFVEDKDIEIKPLAPVRALFERVHKLEYESAKLRRDLCAALDFGNMS